MNTLLCRVLTAVAGISIAQLAIAVDALQQPDPPFKGKIGFSAKDSIPDWPKPVAAPKGAPNIAIILLDDVGFADAGTFGGAIQTPKIDKLAKQGLVYNNFNTTAICSATRAALLTGRNHHRVGFGSVTDFASGYPGYNSIWKKSTASVAEVLRQNGYSTAAFGKWHNTPEWEISPVGPFDHWPTNLGFEYFYGFIKGSDNQWEPSTLFRDTTPVEPPASAQRGYQFTVDIADEAIGWLHTHDSVAPDKPYFLYFATGAVHAPHQAPKEWIDKYHGQFDLGWDKLREEIFARQKKLGIIPANAELTPRPEGLPAWDSFPPDARRLFARQMEVYAAYLAFTDYEVGRLLDTIRREPNSDNTLIFYIVGDNGSSSAPINGDTDSDSSVKGQLPYIDELGGPLHSSFYALGWAWAGTTPFQWIKLIASHFGGTRNPVIVSWPERIKSHGMRSQFTHVNDVAATIYDVTGIRFPSMVNGVKQQPLDGASFAKTFNDVDAASLHQVQYFEVLGNRAIYRDGWVAAARHTAPWVWDERNDNYRNDRWELYHVADDFSEAHDLATQYPNKLKELQQLFDKQAHANDVYPLSGANFDGQPSLVDDRHVFTYYPDMPRLPLQAVPPLVGRSYCITADAVMPEKDARGIIVSYGSRLGGFVFYVKNNHLVFENHPSAHAKDVVISDIPLPRGKVLFLYEFIKDDVKQQDFTVSGDVGTVRLSINGRVVGEKNMTLSVGGGSFGVGQAFSSPVSDSYKLPFKFTGTLKEVRVKLK